MYTTLVKGDFLKISQGYRGGGAFPKSFPGILEKNWKRGPSGFIRPG